MKNKHTVIALIIALVIACSMVAQAGFTVLSENFPDKIHLLTLGNPSQGE